MPSSSTHYRNLRPSRALRERLVSSTRRLDRHFRRMTAVDWSVGFDNGHPVATCVVRAGSGRFMARAHAPDVYTAIDASVVKLLSQCRRVKRRLRRRRRRAGT